MTFETFAIRVTHPVYGTGWFQHVLPEPGHACAHFDGTPDFAPGRRRVLARHLTPVRTWSNCPGCFAPDWCEKHQQCAAEFEPPLRGEAAERAT